MRALRAAAQAAAPPAKADIALAALLCGQSQSDRKYRGMPTPGPNVRHPGAGGRMAPVCAIPPWPAGAGLCRHHNGRRRARRHAGAAGRWSPLGAGRPSDAPVRFPGARTSAAAGDGTRARPGRVGGNGIRTDLAPPKYLKPPTGRRVVPCRADDNLVAAASTDGNLQRAAQRRRSPDGGIARPERRGNGTTSTTRSNGRHRRGRGQAQRRDHTPAVAAARARR